MKTNNKEGFLYSCFAYLVVTVLDLYFTYLGTPNLALEGNPLYNVVFLIGVDLLPLIL